MDQSIGFENWRVKYKRFCIACVFSVFFFYKFIEWETLTTNVQKYQNPLIVFCYFCAWVFFFILISILLLFSFFLNIPELLFSTCANHRNHCLKCIVLYQLFEVLSVYYIASSWVLFTWYKLVWTSTNGCNHSLDWILLYQLFKVISV